jgi:hypothetical protein
VVTTILAILVGLYLLFCAVVMVADWRKNAPQYDPDKPIRLMQDNLIHWSWQRGKWSVCYRIRTKYLPLSRFGAGWSWALGGRLGSSAIILNLLIAEMYVCWQTPAPRTRQDRKDDHN